MNGINLLAVGDWVLLAGLPGALYFTFGYALTAPWWKSSVGIIFVGLGVAIVTVDVVVLATLFFGKDYPGREIYRVVGYVMHVLAIYALDVVWTLERRSYLPAIPLHRIKGSTVWSMFNTGRAALVRRIKRYLKRKAAEK